MTHVITHIYKNYANSAFISITQNRISRKITRFKTLLLYKGDIIIIKTFSYHKKVDPKLYDKKKIQEEFNNPLHFRKPRGFKTSKGRIIYTP